MSELWLEKLTQAAEKNGYAIVPLTDGYAVCFRRLYLQSLIDGTLGPAVLLNVKQPDGSLIETIDMSKSSLQAQVDATDTTSRLILVVWTREAPKN